ncbi:minor tail protein [Mycobacterium phage Mabel]|nr:minor tail protein [Mycobacterium phage Bowtie]QHJ86539.1 minor tail protein [Mycobacterium phage Mabel]
MEVFNPDNTLEVVLLAFVALCGLVGSVAPVWLKLRRIDHQVSNTHDTNLRDDLDSVKADVSAVKDDISDLKEIVLHGFHQINESLNLERRERIEGDRLRAACTSGG